MPHTVWLQRSVEVADTGNLGIGAVATEIDSTNPATRTGGYEATEVDDFKGLTCSTVAGGIVINCGTVRSGIDLRAVDSRCLAAPGRVTGANPDCIEKEVALVGPAHTG